jgi:drug/metabolite transporter (DMT)-like permease
MPPAGRPLLGVGLAAMAVLSFALGDALTKHLAERYPVSVVMALRYGVGLVVLSAVFVPRMRSALWSVSRRWLVLMRGLVLAVAWATMGLALQRMPLGETVAIIYLAPFAVLLLSAPVLGERVGRAPWLGAAIGSAGVLLILRPGGGLDALGVVFALINAVCSTA